eukprot:scaffold1928_cov381-Prasinococcus_capsulatus_cf.AAC.21
MQEHRPAREFQARHRLRHGSGLRTVIDSRRRRRGCKQRPDPGPGVGSCAGRAHLPRRYPSLSVRARAGRHPRVVGLILPACLTASAQGPGPRALQPGWLRRPSGQRSYLLGSHRQCQSDGCIYVRTDAPTQRTVRLGVELSGGQQPCSLLTLSCSSSGDAYGSSGCHGPSGGLPQGHDVSHRISESLRGY